MYWTLCGSMEFLSLILRVTLQNIFSEAKLKSTCLGPHHPLFFQIGDIFFVRHYIKWIIIHRPPIQCFYKNYVWFQTYKILSKIHRMVFRFIDSKCKMRQEIYWGEYKVICDKRRPWISTDNFRNEYGKIIKIFIRHFII